MDLMALHAALDCAATAITEAETGRPRQAQAAALEAAFSASGAFETGTAEADALHLILGVVAGAAGCLGAAA